MEITPPHLILVGPAPPSPRAFPRIFTSAGAWLGVLWQILIARGRAPKPLLLCATTPLGDRRYVAVVQFAGQRFLIGSSPTSVTLLARLPDVAEPECGPTAASTGAEQ